MKAFSFVERMRALRQCCLEAVFEFPGEITLPEHVRKGPPLTVLDEEKLFLSNFMLSR